MTKDQFARATGINASLADKWYPHIIKTMDEFGINTPLREAHFLAQIGTESRGWRAVVESLDYSVAGLAIFRDRLTAAQREKLGRKPGELALSPARQAEISNIVYGGRYGNTQPDDGWKYRGRGLKQVTFKANYDTCGKALGLDLVNNPDLLLLDQNAARSAGWFWSANSCNSFADKDDIVGLTKRINGGTNGLDDRKARYSVAKSVLVGK
ncbi:glycoside hydrolase family 19 protein [Phytobacter ursingii]